MAEDFDDLPFDYGVQPRPAMAKPKRCGRHRWEETHVGGILAAVCVRCGKTRAPDAVKRSASSRRAGKNAERAIAAAYPEGKRTGQFGGPDDVVVGDLFIIQSKATQGTTARIAFPLWAAQELDKLPRTGGRIPTVIISHRAGQGVRHRRLVIRYLDDDINLHGTTISGRHDMDIPE